MENDNIFEDAVNRKALIRLKLLLNYYHNGENTRNADIVEEMSVAKSEVSACVTELVQAGYLEDAGNRKKRLTDEGYKLATIFHGRYEISLMLMRQSFGEDEAKAIRYAEIMTVTTADEVFTRFMSSTPRSILAEKMKRFTKFKGNVLCEKADPGIYQVEISFMKVLDSNYLSLKEMKKTGQSPHTAEHPAEHASAPAVITDDDVYQFVEEFSMADRAFVTPVYLHFADGKGYLHLHRRVMREKTHDGYEMEGQAMTVEVFNGKKFISCPFVEDDVQIPVKYFYFIRTCGRIVGKVNMRFTCTVGNQMPPRVAKVIIKL